MERPNSTGAAAGHKTESAVVYKFDHAAAQGSWISDPQGRGKVWRPNPNFRAPEEPEAERKARLRPILERQAAKRLAEAEAVAVIERETGLSRDEAHALYLHRQNPLERGYIPPEKLLLGEALEEKWAKVQAEHAFSNRGNGNRHDIDWDRLDEQRNRGPEPPPHPQPNCGPSAAPQQPESWPADKPLPYVDLALDPIPARQWLVPERIPMRNITMLGGEGSIGKSLLLMQLSGATVLGKDWIGTLPEPGPVLYMSCEEDDEEVCRRMDAVARHLGSTRTEMIEHGLRFLSFAGRNAVLAQPDRSGIMRPVPLFERVRADAKALRPKLIVLDNLADIFAGKEIDRAQVRQFVTMLRGLAIDTDSAVVMAAHPSLTGISTDTGLSGSTGWHNSVRARMYFKPAPGEDTALRVLEVKKNNYGPVNESIVLRWKDGVYRVEPGLGTLERLAAEAEIDFLFLQLLRRFTEQGRNVSDKPSSSYAPSVFAEQPEAKRAKATKQELAKAMTRLFAANKLRVSPVGRMRNAIVQVQASADAPTDALQIPTDALQTPTDAMHTHTPYNPPPVCAGVRAFADAPPAHGPDGRDSGVQSATTMGPAFLTNSIKQRLRERGFSERDILEMAPEQAHRILGLMPER
jgi:RecA-family ATPase